MLTLVSRDHSHADATHRGAVWCLSLPEETRFQFLFENVQWQTVVERGWCKLYIQKAELRCPADDSTLGRRMHPDYANRNRGGPETVYTGISCLSGACNGRRRANQRDANQNLFLASQKVRAVGRRRNRVSVRIKSVLMVNLALHVRHRFTSALHARFMLCFVNTCYDQGAENTLYIYISETLYIYPQMCYFREVLTVKLKQLSHNRLRQLCTKTSERICMTFSGNVGNGSTNICFNFGGDQDYSLKDTGIICGSVTIGRYGKWYQPTRHALAGIAIATMTSLRHQHYR